MSIPSRSLIHRYVTLRKMRGQRGVANRGALRGGITHLSKVVLAIEGCVSGGVRWARDDHTQHLPKLATLLAQILDDLRAGSDNLNHLFSLGGWNDVISMCL
jgi:hypothetical protein